MRWVILRKCMALHSQVSYVLCILGAYASLNSNTLQVPEQQVSCVSSQGTHHHDGPSVIIYTCRTNWHDISVELENALSDLAQVYDTAQPSLVCSVYFKRICISWLTLQVLEQQVSSASSRTQGAHHHDEPSVIVYMISVCRTWKCAESPPANCGGMKCMSLHSHVRVFRIF